MECDLTPIGAQGRQNGRSAGAGGARLIQAGQRELVVFHIAHIDIGNPVGVLECDNIINGRTLYCRVRSQLVDKTTLPEVRKQYQQIITGALQRAAELETPGLVVEFETLPPMTENPSWGI